MKWQNVDRMHNNEGAKGGLSFRLYTYTPSHFYNKTKHSANTNKQSGIP